jgi:hypothetical protein
MQKTGPKDESGDKNHFGPHEKEDGSDCFARLCLVSIPSYNHTSTSVEIGERQCRQCLVAVTIHLGISKGPSEKDVAEEGNEKLERREHRAENGKRQRHKDLAQSLWSNGYR